MGWEGQAGILMVRTKGKRLTAGAEQRLTFPFPFVHHQPPDWKVEQLLTVEPRAQSTVQCCVHFPWLVGCGVLRSIGWVCFSYSLFSQPTTEEDPTNLTHQLPTKKMKRQNE